MLAMASPSHRALRDVAAVCPPTSGECRLHWVTMGNPGLSAAGGVLTLDRRDGKPWSPSRFMTQKSPSSCLSFGACLNTQRYCRPSCGKKVQTDPNTVTYEPLWYLKSIMGRLSSVLNPHEEDWKQTSGLGQIKRRGDTQQALPWTRLQPSAGCWPL